MHFLNSPLSDSALEDWVSKSTYWAQLEKKLLKNFRVLFHLLFHCLQMCLFSPSISKPRSLRLSIQYSIVIQKQKSQKTQCLGWTTKYWSCYKTILYTYNLLFIISLNISITFVRLSLNFWLIIYLYVGIFDMFWFRTSAL